MTDERYAEGQREATECTKCGQPIWIVYHGPRANHTIEPRLASAAAGEGQPLYPEHPGAKFWDPRTELEPWEQEHAKVLDRGEGHAREDAYGIAGRVAGETVLSEGRDGARLRPANDAYLLSRIARAVVDAFSDAGLLLASAAAGEGQECPDCGPRPPMHVLPEGYCLTCGRDWSAGGGHAREGLSREQRDFLIELIDSAKYPPQSVEFAREVRGWLASPAPEGDGHDDV